ncbi:MAG: hypothetical protein BWY21_00579 [Parcubacteria group bacterium ADurb.Bin216]|nr:MAG: hypothetical protein BWY21_00579 [Parcubacteria group bacterium ADurb.Bin216]
MNENTWELESFTVELQHWGEDIGKYKGRVTFRNKEYELFSIKVSQDKSAEILKLITAELSQAALDFTDKINSSLEQTKPKEQ